MARPKVLFASLLLSALFILFGLKPGHLALGGWSSDHVSHVDSVILFRWRGLDVLRKPIRALAPRSASAAAAEDAARFDWPPQDIFDLPERPGRRPLMINWSFIPRPYPPGVLLYSLPEAALKEAFDLGPRAVAVLSLLKFLLVAHLFLWLFGRSLGPTAADPVAVWVILPLAWLETLSWTLAGVYDGVFLAALVVSVDRLRRGRALDALLWYSIAAVLHFRALWYLPLGAYAGWLALRSRPRGLGAWAKAGASAALLACSLGTLRLLSPWIMPLQKTNFFFFSGDAASWARWCYLLCPIALIGAPLARERAWLALACLAWTLVMVARSPFVQMWHSLSLLPLFAMTGLGERSPARARYWILLAYLVLASVAFTHFPFSGQLALDAAKELFG